MLACKVAYPVTRQAAKAQATLPHMRTNVLDLYVAVRELYSRYWRYWLPNFNSVRAAKSRPPYHPLAISPQSSPPFFFFTLHTPSLCIHKF